MNQAVLSGQTSLIITFLASFLIWFMFLGLFILYFVNGRVKREEVLHALISALIAWGFSQMIKSLFPTERPFEIYETIPMTMTVPFDGAFPSGHTASTFAMAFSIWLHDKKVGFIFIFLAVLVGYARIASRVHFPGDVIGGAAVGVLTAYLFDKVHLKKIV